MIEEIRGIINTIEIIVIIEMRDIIVEIATDIIKIIETINMIKMNKDSST